MNPQGQMSSFSMSCAVMEFDKLKLNMQVGFITFFLSSVLDNLTSTIVMVSLLRKLVPPSEYRKYVCRYVIYFRCNVLPTR